MQTEFTKAKFRKISRVSVITLKTLEADGLVLRTVYPQIPPRVEKRLTGRGTSLIPPLHGLVGWAAENLTDIRESRRSFGIEPGTAAGHPSYSNHTGQHEMHTFVTEHLNI